MHRLRINWVFNKYHLAHNEAREKAADVGSKHDVSTNSLTKPFRPTRSAPKAPA